MTRRRFGPAGRRYCFYAVIVCMAGCGAAAPTAPTAPTASASGMRLVCPSSLLVGQTDVCSATMPDSNGRNPLVSFVASWSATPPGVVDIDNFSAVTGRSVGTATVRATYEGKSATAEVVVRAEDGLVVASASTQGGGRVGEPLTIGFYGYYSVVSADRGTLTVVIRTGDGTVLGTAAQDAIRGGGRFALTNTIPMTTGTGRLCGTAGLRIAGRDVEPTGPLARPICIDTVP